MASPQVAVPRIVIVGCGFGGLEAARSLRNAAVEITLVDRTNHHLFQPLLYQVATAGLSAPAIAAPVRHLFRKQPNLTTLLGEVTAIDPQGRQVLLQDGMALPYDHLIVAAGATHSYFGHDEWEPHAPGLKTLDDAFEIRRRILLAFEAAEKEPDPARREAWLTFVVIGGGPTGVEMAGTLAEIACHTLPGEFRRIDPAQARIILLEGSTRLLQAMPEDLSRRAREQLEQLGVQVRLGALVTAIDAGSVVVKPAAGDGSRKLHHRQPLRDLGRRRSGIAARPATGPGGRRAGRSRGPHRGGAGPRLARPSGDQRDRRPGCGAQLRAGTGPQAGPWRLAGGQADGTDGGREHPGPAGGPANAARSATATTATSPPSAAMPPWSTCPRRWDASSSAATRPGCSGCSRTSIS